MSACAKCNHENSPGSRFCSECGGPLSTACPACNFAGSPPGAKFCAECGGTLGAAAPKAPGAPGATTRPAGAPPPKAPGGQPPTGRVPGKAPGPQFARPAGAPGAPPAAGGPPRPGPGGPAPAGAPPRPGPGGPPRPGPALAGGPPRPGAAAGGPPRPGPAGAPPKKPEPSPPQSPHVLMRVGAPPLPMTPGQSVTFGREECTLTIPSPRVSRRHAEITWEGGQPVLADLGSSNGTQVNGKRLSKPHPLQDGDEITVGPYLCTYKDQRKGGAAQAGPDANMLTAPMLADAMAGRLDQMSLFELLQTLELNQKTGLLEVFGADNSGKVGMKDGKPVYAEAEGTTGVNAIHLLLREKEGQFTFGPGFDPAVPADVSMPVTAILMEASRRQDEGN